MASVGQSTVKYCAKVLWIVFVGKSATSFFFFEIVYQNRLH